MSFDCPNCGSPQTSSFEMMHQQGPRSGSISASTVTYGGDVGFTNGQFNSQTILAGRLAPPVEPRMGCGIQMLIFAGSVILSILISGAILTVIDMFVEISHRNDVMALPFVMITGFLLSGLYLYNRFVQQNRIPAYRDQLEEWTNSMICRRCGFIWVR